MSVARQSTRRTEGVGSQHVWKPLLPPLKQTCSLQPPPPSTAGAGGLAVQQELVNFHRRSAGEHQPPKLPATGVQQYEPAEALQEGLQEA